MKKKLTIFSSLKFGTGDYVAHLYPHLKELLDVDVISFSHMAYDDLVTPEESELVFKNILNPHLLLRPTTFKTLAESYVKIDNFLTDNQPEIFNLQITAFIRVLHFFFFPLITGLKKRGVKILFTFHDVLHIGEENLINNQILTPFYHLSDGAMVGNESEKERLEKIFGYKNKITIGHHGVYDLFDQNIINKSQARKKLNLLEDEFVVLFFGILRENKGLNYLIRSFAKIKKLSLTKKVRLYVAATVRSQFEQINYFQQLIKQLDLTDIITLNISNKKVFKLNEIETFFKATDTVVLPYTHISQSGILNLAIGFKKPVIITDAFIESKEIADKLGMVVPMKDEQSLTNAIVKMANNFQPYSTQFQENLADYQKKHDWKKLAKEMFEFSKIL